jgi:hypothetical protein
MVLPDRAMKTETGGKAGNAKASDDDEGRDKPNAGKSGSWRMWPTNTIAKVRERRRC